MPAKYKRVLLKLSGEVLLDRASGRCIDPAIVAKMAAKVKAVRDMGADVAIEEQGAPRVRGGAARASAGRLWKGSRFGGHRLRRCGES